MKALLIDAVEYPPEWPREQVLDAWFGPLRESVAHLEWSVVAVSDPDCHRKALEAEAVVITGSPRDADCADPAVLELLETLRELTFRETAVLGICFGHQLLARALGGDVARNPAGWEVGSARISLTEDGLRSPLLQDLEKNPVVLQSHQDHVSNLPPGAVLLAGNGATPVQAFQSAPGGKQFGVQFHPEFTPERLRKNWALRRTEFTGPQRAAIDHALDRAEPALSTMTLFRRFFEIAAG